MWRQWSDDESDPPSFERIDHPPSDRHKPDDIPTRGHSILENPAFRCCRCKAWIESDPAVAGVKHRNHCPVCLFSRHMDEVKAGDRRSTCGAAMRPVGLTLKHSRNKYATDDGELMLIHLCLNCGKLSINRIAADDNAEQLIAVFEASAGLEKDLVTKFSLQGIRLLGPEELNLVLMRLYGVCRIGISDKLPAPKERANV
jgi:hypothetical protein